MSVTTFLVIQHVLCETTGRIANVLQANGIVLACVRPYQGECISQRIGHRAGLVIVDGPMGVYEQSSYHFLRDEMRLVENTLHARRPILGVCLGSLLLAAAFGAVVTPDRRKEISWHSIRLGQPTATDPLWRGMGDSFTAFHWHGDVFPLPSAAVRLAWSEWTECQAFRYGTSAGGCLFHLEVTEKIIRRMARTFRREMLDSGVSDHSVLEGIRAHLPGLQDIGQPLFQRWAHLVPRATTPASAEFQCQSKPPSSFLTARRPRT